jgi:ribonuclease HII
LTPVRKRPSPKAVDMPYLIGTDEAGYGPNLGPLVISATLWHTPDGVREDDLYTTLAGVVSRHGTPDSAARVPIADSKSLYKAAGSLQALECGVLTAWRAIGLDPVDWRAAWAQAAPSSLAALDCDPWYADFELSLPLHHDSASLERLADIFLQALRAADVRLLNVRSVIVPPEQFNGELDRWGNKATVLSTLTLDLVRAILPAGDGQCVFVSCDKHGGRQRYADLLQAAFPEYLVEIYGECRSHSLYRWGPAASRFECRFLEKAERLLPVALASMASKYLRELAMLAFNAFWRQHLPNLRPTAGYPEDARRFRDEIAACQQRLGIADRILWRNR